MIAFIADIHGNLPALEAVLDEIERLGCKKIYSLGDIAGYYCFINECIEVLRDRDILNIKGNHDDYLVSGRLCARSTVANQCLAYQAKVIRPENLAWLSASLPSLKINNISLVHGGWVDPLDEYLYELSSAYFEQLEGQYFFSGHTHVQTLQYFGDKAYCNPGSVGQPRDGDPKAAFSIYDQGKITLRRIQYDIDAVAAGMSKAGFDEYTYQNLYQGTRIGGAISKVTVS